MMLQLMNNMGCVFMKFVREGKCTIRLCEPPVDICVSKVNTYVFPQFHFGIVMVWHSSSGSALVLSSVVATLRMRLVLGWVTVCGFKSCLQHLDI